MCAVCASVSAQAEEQSFQFSKFRLRPIGEPSESFEIGNHQGFVVERSDSRRLRKNEQTLEGLPKAQEDPDCVPRGSPPHPTATFREHLAE